MTTIIRAEAAHDFLALVPALVGYRPARSVLCVAFDGNRTGGVLRHDLPDGPDATDALVRAVVGTVCAAMGFVVEYALGGAAPASLSTVAGYLFGTHVLIGIGEGVITALTVVAVARTRPDLVFLLRRPDLPWDADAILQRRDGRGGVAPTVDALLDAVKRAVVPGDRVLFMSNGGFEAAPQRFAEWVLEKP